MRWCRITSWWVKFGWVLNVVIWISVVAPASSSYPGPRKGGDTRGDTETWFITATSCRSVGECRAPSHLDSSMWCFFHLSQRSQKKLGFFFFCISIFFFCIHVALRVYSYSSGKYPVFFLSPFFLLLRISKSFFALRKFCGVFTLLLFLVFVCAVWLPHPGWCGSNQKPPGRLCLWYPCSGPEIFKHVTGGRPGSKLSYLVPIEVDGNFCLWGEMGWDRANRHQVNSFYCCLLFTCSNCL